MDMSDGTDLTTFLAARLDEDEATARRMLDGAEPYVWPWEVWVTPGVRDDFKWEVQPSIGIAEHAPKAYRRVWDQAEAGYPGIDDGWGVHDSAICVWSEDEAKRRLRDIEADRELLAAYVEVADMDRDDPEPEYAYGRAVGLGEAVRLRAARFSDHPDFQQEWKL